MIFKTHHSFIYSFIMQFLIKYTCVCVCVCVYFFFNWGFPEGSVIKNLPTNAEIPERRVGSQGWEDPLEEEMVTYSSFLV